GQQVDDDPGQPGGDQVGAVARLDQDDQPGDDLHHAHQVHEVGGGAGQQPVDPGSQILLPVDEDVEELVESEHDRRNGEPDPQEPEALVCRIPSEQVAVDQRIGRPGGSLNGGSGHDSSFAR